MILGISALHIAASLVVIWSLRWLYGTYATTSPLENIPGPPAPSWFIGNLGQLFDRQGWSFMRSLTEDYGAIVKIRGFFGHTQLYVFDPLALQTIVRDQDTFEETDVFVATNQLFFGGGLLSKLGDEHRRQRKILLPFFSNEQMRRLSPMFHQICTQLCQGIDAELHDGPTELDMLYWTGRVSIELIGRGGLGYSFDPLVEDANNPYGRAIKALTSALSRVALGLLCTPFLMKLGSSALRRRLLLLVPSRRVQHAREVVDEMRRNARQLFEMKQRTLQEGLGDEDLTRQVGQGEDILRHIMEANLTAAEDDKLSDDDLVGTLGTLVFAAMDTTSVALAHALEQLSLHKDIQERLRKEISFARDGSDQIPYENLLELPYLDAICRETLRLFPPVLSVGRTVTQDTALPLSRPIRGRDGKLIDSITLPKNTDIHIGILSSNRSKELWGPDADEWKPERWLDPLQRVSDAHVPGVYSHLMTFVGGGRSCIGFKFAILEIKTVISSLVECFEFTPSEKPIHWNISGIQYPTTSVEDTKPSLPIKVSRLAKA